MTVYLIVVASYDPMLTAVALVLTMLNFVGLALTRRRREDLCRQLMNVEGRMLATSVDIIRSIETIKASGLEQSSFARWAGFQARALQAEQKPCILDGVDRVMPIVIQAITMAAVLGVGGFRVMDGLMSIGTLVAFQSLVASFEEPVTNLVDLSGRFQESKADLARLDDVLHHPVDPLRERVASENSGVPLAKLNGALTVTDLTFGYGALDPPLVENFSLAIRPGMRVALVGASGSGKSTIGRMICGLCQPWTGEVRIDGILVGEIPPEVFAGSVAYVDQDVFLFEGTLRDNLTLWDASIPGHDIERALLDAAIDDDIALRPGHHDCAVSEGGRNFSGGQRQRLEIARALVGNPSLLVLDEATAALDPVTEKRIDDNLRRRGCSCIIIAHRLSTIRDCDEILVLDNGRVVERGDHERLLASAGLYAHLIHVEN